MGMREGVAAEWRREWTVTAPPHSIHCKKQKKHIESHVPMRRMLTQPEVGMPVGPWPALLSIIIHPAPRTPVVHRAGQVQEDLIAPGER